MTQGDKTLRRILMVGFDELSKKLEDEGVKITTAADYKLESPSAVMTARHMVKIQSCLTSRLPRIHRTYKEEIFRHLTLWQYPWAIAELRHLADDLEEEYEKRLSA